MTNATPQLTPMTVQLNSLPYQDAFMKIAGVYADSTRASMEQLWISSSKIVMEETIKALMAASQSCMEALSKNAMSVQQQSIGRFINANQKAVEIMGQTFTEAMTAGWKPAR